MVAPKGGVQLGTVRPITARPVPITDQVQRKIPGCSSVAPPRFRCDPVGAFVIAQALLPSRTARGGSVPPRRAGCPRPV